LKQGFHYSEVLLVAVVAVDSLHDFAVDPEVEEEGQSEQLFELLSEDSHELGVAAAEELLLG